MPLSTSLPSIVLADAQKFQDSRAGRECLMFESRLALFWNQQNTRLIGL